MSSDMKMDMEKIEALEKEIALLKSQWPAHSVPAAMLERLDELEEALEQELQKKPTTNVLGAKVLYQLKVTEPEPVRILREGD